MEPINLHDLPARELMPGFWGKLLHTEQITLGLWELTPGAVLPEHAHPHEQTTHLLAGEFEMTIGGQTQHLRAGDVVVIPGQVPHSGRAAFGPCKILDVFSPVREDYREKWG
jgi:quercetin dioxygenase-like cupin family protein